MYTDITVWTFAYVVDTALLAGAAILFWSGLKNYLLRRELRGLMFGSGWLFLAFSYLVMCIYNSSTMPPLIVVPLAIGSNLILWSLIKRKWEYVLLFLNILPILIAVDGKFSPIFALVPLVLAGLSYRNYCFSKCPEPDNYPKKIAGDKNIAILFLIMTINVALGTSAQSGHTLFSSELVLFGIIITEALMATVILYHVLHSSHYGARERLLMPVLVGFIVLLSFVSFYSNQKIRVFNQVQLAQLSLKETRAALLISQSYLGEEGLTGLINKEDPALNDIADTILLETGVRTAFFKGDRRVAASISSAGGGRYIGTRLNDEDTERRVLEEGEEATAIIRKNNQDLVASYLPITHSGQTIGMIGTGILMTNYYKEQDALMFKIATASFATFVLVFVLMAHETIQKPKKRQ